mgnify:CR=1 FL=1
MSLSLGTRGDANYTVSSSPEGKRTLSVPTSTTFATASHVFNGYSLIQVLGQQKKTELGKLEGILTPAANENLALAQCQCSLLCASELAPRFGSE